MVDVLQNSLNVDVLLYSFNSRGCVLVNLMSSLQ